MQNTNSTTILPQASYFRIHMPLTLDDIKHPVAKHLQAFDYHFREALRSKAPLLDIIMQYIIKRKGKQIRPLFVFLSAQVLQDIKPKTYRAAILVELLHTATLVHDDVVDSSMQRRGFLSVNALWKNKVSVLAGDYMLAKGLLLAVDDNDFDLLRIVSDATRQMSEGELLQIEKTRRLNLSETTYFEIIRQKTATLMGAACACGAASVTEDIALIQQLYKIGETAGMAFQIKDDLLDFAGYDIGKPRGIDIKEKKLTLPVIYALNNASFIDRQKHIYTLRLGHTNPIRIKDLMTFIYKSGGIEYATQKMQELRKECHLLISELPANAAQQSLEHLIDFVVERQK